MHSCMWTGGNPSFAGPGGGNNQLENDFMQFVERAALQSFFCWTYCKDVENNGKRYDYEYYQFVAILLLLDLLQGLAVVAINGTEINIFIKSQSFFCWTYCNDGQKSGWTYTSFGAVCVAILLLLDLLQGRYSKERTCVLGLCGVAILLLLDLLQGRITLVRLEFIYEDIEMSQSFFCWTYCKDTVRNARGNAPRSRMERRNPSFAGPTARTS